MRCALVPRRDGSSYFQTVAVPAPQTSPAEEPEGELQPAGSVLSWQYWEEVTGLTGLALVTYLLISEGSRVLYPPRNFVPVP